MGSKFLRLIVVGLRVLVLLFASTFFVSVLNLVFKRALAGAGVSIVVPIVLAFLFALPAMGWLFNVCFPQVALLRLVGMDSAADDLVKRQRAARKATPFISN